MMQGGERSHMGSRAAWSLGEELRHITVHDMMALTYEPCEWYLGSNIENLCNYFPYGYLK